MKKDKYYDTDEWDILKAQAKERDKNRCVHCLRDTGTLIAHHIVPRKMGGEDALFNLATLCPECHARAHTLISNFGLCTIPSGFFYENWYELTRQEDVLAYARNLDRIGIDGEYLRDIERLRDGRGRK